MEHIKTALLAAFGIVGGLISTALGGWDTALIALVIFMGVDWGTGLIVAGVFKRSSKSKTGALESRAGFKGLCRKGMILLIVWVAVLLDTVIGSDFARDSVIIAFMVNEAISITENAGLMGVPIPDKLTKAIEILKNKGDNNGEH